MQKTFKRTVAVLMVALMMIMSVPLTPLAEYDWSFFKAAAANEAAIEWVYDTATNTLTISGEGDMLDYAAIENPVSTTAPWFSHAPEITKVVIEEGITSVGDFSFALCENLTEVNLSSTVTHIGMGAFVYCGFTNITIPVSVTSIGEMAFYGEKFSVVFYEGTEEQWNEISIDDSNDDTLFDNVYFNTSGGATEGYYTYLLDTEGTEATIIAIDSNAISGDVVIPDTLGGCPVTKIGNSVFAECDNLTSVTIPDTVNSIGDMAFAYCSKLTKVTLPKNLTEIAYGTFAYCRALKSVEIPYGVTNIGGYAFGYCNSLANINIPDSVTTIGEAAFYECSSFTNLVIPDSVTSLGEGAFACCYALVCDIYISKNLTSIGNGAFTYANITSINVDKDNPNYSSDAYGALFNKDQTTLIRYPVGNERTTYRISENVTAINSNALRGCYNLQSITVDENHTKYSSDANGILYNKDKTKIYLYPAGNKSNSLTVSEGVEEISAWAFYNCYNLVYVTLPDSVKSLGDSAFYGCHNLKNVTNLPNISSQMFQDCYNLESITIPDGTESIPYQTFCNCTSLTSVTITASVTSISYAAFNNCPNLKDVYYNGTEAQWNNISIYENEDLTNATIHFNGNQDYNIDWSYDEATKTLTISGEGAMPDYTYEEYEVNGAPWSEHSLEIEKVIVEEGITSIGAFAFLSCTKIKEIVLPEGLTELRTACFAECHSLTDINLPSTLQKIDTRVFSWCFSLEELVLPDSIETLGKQIFIMTGIKKINIPANLKNFQDDTFYGLIRLREVTVPKDAECILPENAFPEAYVLEKITNYSPKAVVNCDYIAIGGCFDSITYADAFSQIGLNEIKVGEIALSPELGYTEADLIEESVYYLNNTINTNLNPSDYENWEAFTDAAIVYFEPHMLEGVYPEFYTVYCHEGSAQHNYCAEKGINYELYNIDWDFDKETGTLTISGEGDMPDYTDAANGDGNAPWLSYASDITKVVIEEGITSVGDCSFIFCDNLTEVVLPEGITDIGNGAFGYCVSLMRLTLPSTVTYIGDAAFMGCINLYVIPLPDSIEHIGADAFNMTAIEELYIPTGLKTVVGQPFSQMWQLKTVYIDGETTCDLTNAFGENIVLEAIKNESLTTAVNNDYNGYVFDDARYAKTMSALLLYSQMNDQIEQGLPLADYSEETLIYAITSHVNEEYGTSYEWTDFSSFNDIYREVMTNIIAPHIVHDEYPSYYNVICHTYGDQHDYCVENEIKHTSAMSYMLEELTGEEAKPCTCRNISWSFDESTKTLTISGEGRMPDYSPIEGSGWADMFITGAPWTQYALDIEKVIIEEGVTTVGTAAFAGLKNMKEIVLPEGITDIRLYAFFNCLELTEIDLPSTLETIGAGSFYQCLFLERLVIPAGVKIGEEALVGMYGLKEVIISEGVESADALDFSESINLRKVENHSDSVVVEMDFDGAVMDDTEWAGAYIFFEKYYFKAALFGLISESEAMEIICTYLNENLGTSLVASDYTSFEEDFYDAIFSLFDAHIVDAKYPSYFNMYCLENSAQHTYNVDNCLPHTIIGEEEQCECLHPGEWRTITEQTCTQDGKQEKTCENCGEVIEKILEAPGHDYKATVTDVTCTENGFTTYTCLNCGDTYTDSIIEAAGHTIVTDAAVAPTCTQTGLTEGKHCSVCNTVIVAQTTIPATGHSFGDWEETKAATCTTTGTEKRTCSACGKTESQTIAKLGHNYSAEWTIDRAATCTADGSKSHHCTRCTAKTDVTVIPATGHSFGDWEVTREATCTANGSEKRTCSVCNKNETQSIAALGHNFSTEWTIDRQADCDTDGSKSHHCTRCTEKADVTVIPATGHSFGDWVRTREPNCTSAGAEKRTCSVCNKSETQTVPALGHYYITDWIIEKEPTVLADGLKVKVCYNCGYRNTEKIDRINVDGDENYGVANFTVVNAQTLEPIKGASIYISTENDGENTFYTDENGQVSVLLPVGQQQVTAYKNGCNPRTFRINVVHEGIDVPEIGLSNKSTYETELTHKVMTLEEIKDAGIDVDAIGNQHVVKTEVTMIFAEEVPPIKLETYTAGGKVVGIPDTPTHTVVKGEGYYSRPGPAGGYYYYRPAFGDHPSITIQPISERCYMVIRGETKWLKEMFDVELLVINNSSTDTLENLQATLTLPDGLSLAAMTGDSQSLVQNIGTISEGGSKSAHWYVRGDKEGSYDLSAQLTGTIEPLGEEINDTFTCKDQLKVYAGSALSLNYEFPDSTYYGEDYPVKITLTNTSDRTLYNVTQMIKEVEQGRIIYLPDGETKEYVYGVDTDSSWYAFAEEFKPGDKLIIEISVKVLFGSERVGAQIEKLFGEYADGFKDCYDVVMESIEEISDFTGTVTSAAAAAREAGLDSELVALLEEIEAKLSGEKVFSAVSIFSDSPLFSELRLMAEDIGAWAENAYIEEVIAQLEVLKKVLDSEITAEETASYSVFSSLRTLISSLPGKFVLTQILFTEDENNTTSIPTTFTVVRRGSRSSVTNVNSYLDSIAKSVVAVNGDKTSSILQLIPGVDKAESEAYKPGQATAVQGEKEQFEVTGSSENTGFTIYYVPDDLNSDYTLESDNETAKFENGVLTFTGDGLISVICPGITGGTLYIQDSDGNTYSFVIDVVEKHQCKAGKAEIVLQPSGKFPGLAVKRCEICGDTMETLKATDIGCEEHSFSEWEAVVEATCTSDGINKRQCENCAYSETEYVTASHTDSDANEICDICGESLSEPETPDYVAGDINGDGTVNNKDLNRLMRKLAGDTITVNEAALDVNGDGTVNNKDLNRLMRYLAGDKVELH